VKRGIWIGILATVAFVAILVARLPASWLSGFLPANVSCVEIGGTLWNGSCSGLIAQGTKFGDLAWQLRAAPLLRAHVAGHVDLQHPTGTLSTDVDATAGGDVEMHDLVADLAIDPSNLTQVPPDLRGRVHAQLARLRLEKKTIAAIEGQIDLIDLKRLEWKPAALGDYTLRFPSKRSPGKSGETVGDFDSMGGGPWQIEAVLRLTNQPGLVLEGTIAVGDGAPAEIVEELGQLGPPDAQGRRPFSMEQIF
jgi:hypothetical protein